MLVIDGNTDEPTYFPNNDVDDLPNGIVFDEGGGYSGYVTLNYLFETYGNITGIYGETYYKFVVKNGDDYITTEELNVNNFNSFIVGFPFTP